MRLFRSRDSNTTNSTLRFLDGQSLGAAAAPLDLPYVGLEDFFLPADVDNRLAGPDLSLTNGTSDPSTQQQSLGSDIWW